MPKSIFISDYLYMILFGHELLTNKIKKKHLLNYLEHSYKT